MSIVEQAEARKDSQNNKLYSGGYFRKGREIAPGSSVAPLSAQFPSLVTLDINVQR